MPNAKRGVFPRRGFMKKAFLGWAVVACIFTCVVAAQWNGRKNVSDGKFSRISSNAKNIDRPAQSIGEQYALRASVDEDYVSTAAVDTYTTVYYDFEAMNWQGWTRLDQTAQIDTFWHVEDYLEPELASLQGPLDGMKSAWCGAPPGPADYLCHWKASCGYGNYWDQSFVSDTISFNGYLDLSYRVRVLCEEEYDHLDVEYDAGGHNWVDVASYTGRVEAVDESHRIMLPAPTTKLRFHFTSDITVSDEDGFLDSEGVPHQGAAHIDNITIADADSVINFENFESAPDGAGKVGIWRADVAPAFGMYSGLRYGLGASDKDPCNENLKTQVVFFMGSEHESSAYPGLYDTPLCGAAFGRSDGPCQREMIVSPVIDLAKYSSARNSVQDADIPASELPLMGGTWLRFTTYEDLPVENSVYYNCHVRRVDASGCRGLWSVDEEYYPIMGKPSYAFLTKDITAAVGTADSIQIGFVVLDMCDVWGGACGEHTPAPWFDNIHVVRFTSPGPQWSYQDQDLFQDNFPETELDIESYVRADAARDINGVDNPAIRPGDSIVVGCVSPIGDGLAADPGGGPAIYLHVKCSYIGGEPVKPSLAGSSLQGNYGTYKSDDGTWTIIQGDTARGEGGAVADNYMFDLNDSLFTRGYEIEYYFTARNGAGYESALPRWSCSEGPYFEFTCLPTKNSGILYVDDCSGQGSFAGTAEQYWMSAFSQVVPGALPDRYDVNAPADGVSNGLGARAKLWQLMDSYHTIIWDTGENVHATISDGSAASDKSNDCQMLVNWMDYSQHAVGLWICGDDAAHELNTLSSEPALALMHTWCGADMINSTYFDRTGGLNGGGVVNPLITGDADAGICVTGESTEAFSLDGGCPGYNRFDMFEVMGTSKYALNYPDFEGFPCRAGIANESQNSGGYDVKTLWFGFSFQFIRDDAQASLIDRAHVVADVLQWMQVPVEITGTEIPAAYKLAQNFPNPFNPTTSVRFDMKEKGLVTIRIYNVAGQLVRTLMSGAQDVGAHAVAWDGRNDRGADVGSGIYFYKMETKGFSDTKKMVLLR
jgi:hypothetical protein